MIEITGLSKTYKGSKVLDIEQLAFERGKCYVLFGDNGSGKTTLLRILAGIIAPDEGLIKWNNCDLASIAYMPQKPYAFNMKVWRSIIMSLPAKDKKSGKEAAGRLLKSIGAPELAESIESKLSGGESQKVAFVRVISVAQQLLLLDEPTSAMDKEGAYLVESLLKQYREQNNATVIIATHSVYQATRIADEAILMENGKVIKKGAVEEVAKERI